MKNLKKVLGYNIKSLLGFEFIYKLLSTIIFVPLFLMLFKFITNISGYSYLTFENVVSFLLNPLTLLFIFILLVLITFYTLIDISTIIVILDSSYQEKKISIKEAFTVALLKSLRVFHFKNILLPFLVIFLIPFLNFGISSSFISTIKIPEFILDYIKNNGTLLMLYIALIFILSIVLFRWLFSLHFFLLEDCNFKEARKRSINLSKKNKIKDFLSILLTQTVLFIMYVLFILLGIVLIILIYKWLGKVNIFGNLSITVIWLLIAVSFIIVTLLSTPVSYSIISVLYYKHKEKNNEDIKHIKVNSKEKKKLNKKLNVVKYVVIILTIFSGSILTYSVMNDKYDLKIEHVRTIEVTAHRGASAKYPENTMSAFRGAKELGTDWIELDVQQTKDKKLIVLHDTNLKRTTGVNKNTWEVTYDEVEKLDAGSFFSEEFKGEKIPLLEEVIEFAKENDVKLNIELKPTGNETDFESSVVDIINKYDFASKCVVTSQVYSVVENVKAYDKNIKTVYVMSLAYGDILKFEAADAFSIEASSITKKIVSMVHGAGKDIYAWTLNTESGINNMINLNVDNIITDDIVLAKELIYSSKTSSVIQEYIKYINKFLK